MGWSHQQHIIVLGPKTHVNDLPEGLDSYLNMHLDHDKIKKEGNNNEDYITLQG